jgi:hypothetical protein
MYMNAMTARHALLIAQERAHWRLVHIEVKVVLLRAYVLQVVLQRVDYAVVFETQRTARSPTPLIPCMVIE